MVVNSYTSICTTLHTYILYISLSLSLPACPEPAVSTAPWIIAIAIIIPLLVLGLLALLLLKVLLLIFVSHAYVPEICKLDVRNLSAPGCS